MVSAGVDFSGSTHSAGRGTGRIGPGTWARARAPGRPGAHTVTASCRARALSLRLPVPGRAGSRAEAAGHSESFFVAPPRISDTAQQTLFAVGWPLGTEAVGAACRVGHGGRLLGAAHHHVRDHGPAPCHGAGGPGRVLRLPLSVWSCLRTAQRRGTKTAPAAV